LLLLADNVVPIEIDRSSDLFIFFIFPKRVTGECSPPRSKRENLY
jgi:hypothetical protein